jgi:hypothetical protein
MSIGFLGQRDAREEVYEITFLNNDKPCVAVAFFVVALRTSTFLLQPTQKKGQRVENNFFGDYANCPKFCR